MLTIEEVASKFSGAKKTKPTEWKALCPKHNDSDPSLVIHEYNGKIQLKCWSGGCSKDEILAAVGLSWKDVTPFTPKPPLAVYEYHDAAGAKLYWKEKYLLKNGKKGFRFYHLDGAGKKADKRGPHSPQLWRLPEVTAAAKCAGTVYIPEGEKNAADLIKLGLIATTNDNGGGSIFNWRQEYTWRLQGAKRVVILRDEDAVGITFAEHKASEIARVVPDTRLVLLPGLKADSGDDISDWLAKGHTLTELEALVEQTAPYVPKPKSATPEAAEKPQPQSTDMAQGDDLENARALADEVRETMRWHVEDKTWWLFDSTRWREDKEGSIVTRYQAMLTEKGTWRSKAKHVRSAIDFARSHLPLSADRLDVDGYTLNVLNGTLDLRTGQLEPHDPSDMLSKLAPAEYDPDAKCPLFEKFLNEIMSGDAELISFLQRLFGYSLTGDTREEVFGIFYGRGKNGKSTLLEAVRKALGDYSQNADFKTFVRSKSERIRTDLARMRGARLVTASESAEEQALDEQVVKQVVNTKDPITARYLFGREFEFHPVAKILLSCNHKPKVSGTDTGIWRRVLLVPFEVTIKHVDKGLADKLATEAQGILAWLVRGCLEWQAKGLQPPKRVLAATEDYKTDSDPIGEFLSEECEEDPPETPDNEVSKTEVKKIHEAYRTWCIAQDRDYESAVELGKKLSERGFRAQPSNGVRRVLRLRLKAAPTSGSKNYDTSLPSDSLPF